MPSNAIQKVISIDRESTFQTAIADHDSPSANGGTLYVAEEDFTNVRLGLIENQNYKTRPAAKHPMLQGLKSASEGSFSMYMYGASSNAAEGAQAAGLLRDELLLGALASETLGYSAGLVGTGTATAPDITEADLDSQETYAWGWFYDDSAATGRFRKFSTITDGGVGNPDTINMLTGHDLHFTPDDAADVMYAVVAHRPFWYAMEDHSHANHFTHTVFRKGRHTEDSVEPTGLKFGLGQLTITAGERSLLAIPWKSANHTDHEDLAQPSLTGTPSGVPGKTVGSGTETICEIEDVGTALGTNAQNFWGTITIEFGVTYSGVMGPDGQEGVHGWGVETGAYEAQTVEITVPYDDDWFTDFRAGTEKHLLVQVGDTPTNTWGVYFSRLGWREEPQRAEVDGRRALILRFDCLEENTIDISSLAEEAAARAKAKFEILRTG